MRSSLATVAKVSREALANERLKYVQTVRDALMVTDASKLMMPMSLTKRKTLTHAKMSSVREYQMMDVPSVVKENVSQTTGQYFLFLLNLLSHAGSCRRVDMVEKSRSISVGSFQVLLRMYVAVISLRLIFHRQ